MNARTAQQIAAMRRLAAGGLTLAEAAKKLGYSYPHIAKTAKQHGIKFTRTYTIKPSAAERNETICKRYLNGEKQVDLAKEYGITRERVRQIIERAGIVSETKRHEDFVAVVAGTVARKSLTIAQAAEMFGVSRISAYLYCRRHGITPSSRTVEEQAELDALAREVVNGASIRQAAGCDHGKAERLRRHLINNGIKARGRSRHDDFTERKRVVSRWRREGCSWAECAQNLSKHDGRPIGLVGLYNWCKRHMPELFLEDAA